MHLGVVASLLASSTPDWVVRVRALAGDIVLRHLTPTVPLSTQVYKWVPANLIQGGSSNIPSRLMLQKPG